MRADWYPNFRRLLAQFGLGRSPQGSPSRPRSVLLISFHKCATTLFNDYVLKHLNGLQQVDYAVDIYENQPPAALTFEPYGYAYGVIRVIQSPGTPVYETLVKPILAPGFMADKWAVFVIRDPRDILVSEYYSFGFTHGFSKNPAIRQFQEERRARIAAQTVDQYVLAAAPNLQERFQSVQRLSQDCERGVVLKYEQLIEDCDRFLQGFEQLLPLSPEVKAEIFVRSRPKATEDPTAHKRSGKVGGYQDKLQPETIARLDELLAPTLKQFGYDQQSRYGSENP